MDGSPSEKSSETLILQNCNTSELKDKLNEIIASGKDFRYDVFTSLKTLLQSDDREIILLTVQAISEIAKCEIKRETYAHKDVIEPILSYLSEEITLDILELVKQCCRALGNLCCDCDTSRKIILESPNIIALIKVLKTTLDESKLPLSEIKVLMCKVVLNYVIGGQEFSDPLVKEGLTDVLRRILAVELEKESMEDDLVTTVLLIMSVINFNDPEVLFEDELNMCVLNVLKETTSVEVSELCLEHFHSQTEHDSVKMLLAKEGGVKLVCKRLEQLVEKLEMDEINADCEEVDKCMKKACDLIVIVLMGDEAMNLLYDKGKGEIYQIMHKWLDSKNYHLLITGVLAMGNFARQDDHCIQMMENKTFDKLLDIFEHYHAISTKSKDGQTQSIDNVTVNKIEDGTLSAIRNLLVPTANKKVVADAGRAAPIFINALPLVENPTVAYKLMASLRMLVDGQEEVARSLCSSREALAAAGRWGGAGGARAAAEGTRLLARAAHLLPHRRPLLQVEGCVSSLVNMMVSPHAIMQNESILTLTLLAIDSQQSEIDLDSLITQLIRSEIGKHVAVLIETNCAKTFINCVENLIAFLDVTSKNNSILLDYKEANVHESLQKLISKAELSEKLVVCCKNLISIISQVQAEK